MLPETDVDLIEKTIKRVVAQYAIIDGDEQFYNTVTAELLEEFYSSTNPETLQFINLFQSFLDVLLMEIRSVKISYSAQRKRDQQAQEFLLLHGIESLETQLAAEHDQARFQNIDADLQGKKTELDNIYAQGAFIRARAKYKIEGE